MPPNIACTRGPALEAGATKTIVWVTRGPGPTLVVVVGENCAGGWSESIESAGVVGDGLLSELELELELELVW